MGTSYFLGVSFTEASCGYVLAPSSLELQHSIEEQLANCQEEWEASGGASRLKCEGHRDRGMQTCQARGTAALQSVSHGHMAFSFSMANLPLSPS